MTEAGAIVDHQQPGDRREPQEVLTVATGATRYRFGDFIAAVPFRRPPGHHPSVPSGPGRAGGSGNLSKLQVGQMITTHVAPEAGSTSCAATPSMVDKAAPA